MSTISRRKTRLRLSCALAVVAVLAACGGGGGGGAPPISAPPPAPPPSPAPTPSPSPTPTPTPTPTPASTFDTAEFRRSDGPGYHNAVTAWSRGATGKGVKIAVIDSGIDTDSPEFAGRIDPASRDVAGNGTVEDVDGHGTQVAMVAAAARNNTGVVGIAYDATIVALRADRPGSCGSTATPEDGCRFADRDIAAGIDRAIAAGVTVINLSLGGEMPGSTLTDAVRRAAAAGVVVIVAAGNEGDGSDAKIDPNQPNPFAAAVRSAAGANGIVVGSVNQQGQMSAFSNRAGTQASWYLSALGERICCVYENGVLKVETTPSGSFVTVVSGTSFAAPQVSGAVALLKQAFPNLTAAQMVDLLLTSARDAGAAGIDATYGRGILDIAAAFAPRGATVMAGSETAIIIGDNTGVGSGPMGDAMRHRELVAVILDGYGRAYGYDIGQGLKRATVAPRLLGAVDAPSRTVSASSETLSLAFTVSQGRGAPAQWIAPLRLSLADAEGARVLAARAALKLAPGRQIGFAFNERAEGLVAQLQGHEQPAFLIAGDAHGDAGFAQGGDASLAYRTELGRWGLTASAGQGKAWLGNQRVVAGGRSRDREDHAVRSFSLAADRRFGAIEGAAGLTWLGEDRTVLGAHFADALGAGGANSMFLDASAGWRFTEGWRLGGAVRHGWTRADRVGSIGGGSNLVSRAWSADLTKDGVFGRFDSLGLRISQPLRVEGGGLALTLPTSYDYATLAPSYSLRTLTLTPQGREVDGELAWHGPLLGGEAAASLFYRTDPGHVAAMPDDKGVALKWSRRF